MQYQNNDMDDLFRRAADGYPLKLQDEGWDAIAGKLSASAAVTTDFGGKKSKENKYKLVIPGLLLLLITGTTLFLVLNKGDKDINNKIAIKNEVSVKTLSGSKYSPVTNINSNTILISEDVNPNNLVIEVKAASVPPAKQVLVYPADTKTSITSPNLSYVDEFDGKKYQMNENDNRPDGIQTKVQDMKYENGTEKLHPVKPEDKTENMKEAKSIQHEKADEKKKAKKEKRFYVGIFAGPQFDQVKSQGFSNPGLSAGLLTGVTITKKLAIETGIFISQKKYFSSGKYFNIKTMAASMPAGMKVISLDGKSTVLEIPVKIKYDFLQRNKGSFFGTAGVLSYVLTKESNNYLVEVNGNTQKLTGNYSNSEKYFTAALNISAGYQLKAKQTTIRIEPYIQVPIKGIGVGSMPVMSTGIHVGVTLPFH